MKKKISLASMFLLTSISTAHAADHFIFCSEVNRNGCTAMALNSSTTTKEGETITPLKESKYYGISITQDTGRNAIFVAMMMNGKRISEQSNYIAAEGNGNIHPYAVLSVTTKDETNPEKTKTELRNIEIKVTLPSYEGGKFHDAADLHVCMVDLGPAGTKENPISPVSPDDREVRKIKAYRQAYLQDEGEPPEFFLYDFKNVEEILTTFNKESMDTYCP